MCHYKHLKPTGEGLHRGEGLHSQAVWQKGYSIGCIAHEIGEDRSSGCHKIARTARHKRFSACAGQMCRHLRRKGKRVRSKRPKTKGKVEISHSIKDRPRQADLGLRLGDWVDDTLVAAGPVCLLALAGRASRLLAARRCHHDSVDVLKLELSLGRPLKTITPPERGKQFARHGEGHESLGGVQFFFCEPHHLWQKLTVENTDGLIREFLSRGTDCGRAADEEARAAGKVSGRRYVQASRWAPLCHCDHRP
jgi:IS30 family transposase